MNGKTPSEGRLEIHHENVWNTLRSGNMTNLSTVVCRQLRMPFTEAHIVTDVSVFGAGTGRVLNADFTCKPGDIHLKDCTMHKTNVSTEAHLHDRDVGFECKGGKSDRNKNAAINVLYRWGKKKDPPPPQSTFNVWQF